MKIPVVVSAALIAGLSVPGTASAIGISNGTGDGSLWIDVDLFGASDSAQFDPVGPLGSSDPIYYTDVQITQGSFLASLGDAADVGPQLVSQSSNSIQSTFSINQLDFRLTQTVSDAVNDGQVSGSVLTQNYEITNTTDVPNIFSLVRYMDGDLYFNDETLQDGGGVLMSGEQVILYQTDASGSPSDADTFLGITAAGGTQPTGIYDISNCCGVQSFPLTNTVTGDTDGDNFIDNPYDVTLSLARDFMIAPGQTQTFSTQTLFGNSEPVGPGDSENIPLLPDREDMVDEVPVFFFDIPIIEPGEIIWIDPIVAIGYTYEVAGGSFEAVTAPALATIPDADGYMVEVEGMMYALLPGQSLDLVALGHGGATMLVLSGIDPALLLDPSYSLAFPLGLIFDDPGQDGVTVSMTPTILDYTPTADVPLPASGLLLAGVLAGLGGAARRLRTPRSPS